MLDTAIQNINQQKEFAKKTLNTPTDKPEQSFENLLAKKSAKLDSKDVKEADLSIANAKDTKDIKDTKALKATQNAKQATNTATAKSVDKGVGSDFELGESKSAESALELKEKMIKNSKTSKETQEDPLLAALAGGAKNAADSTKTSKESTADNKEVASEASKIAPPKAKGTPKTSPNPTALELANNAKFEAKQRQEQQAYLDKTIRDVESVAKSQNLNPSKINLESKANNANIASVANLANTQTQEVTQKIATNEAPESAKQKINYEYENNTDRIAIVNRGIKKPKNITSKISNEYPSKVSEDEAKLKDSPRPF